MHRKQEADLLPLNTEIERTLKNLRKITVAESRSMENQYQLFLHARLLTLMSLSLDRDSSKDNMYIS